MNAPVIYIELPPETLAKIEQLKTELGQEAMLNAIRQGMDKAAALTVFDIQNKRLTGEGPFPVEEHRLGIGHKNGNHLRDSLRYTPAVIEGDTVTGGIGTNVEYAAIHEFGGVIKRTVKAGSVRLRTKRNGDLERNEWGGAIFAKRKGKGAHSQFREVSFAGGKTYEIRIPARAPIGHGIADNATTFTRAIARAVGRNLRGGTQ